MHCICLCIPFPLCVVFLFVLFIGCIILLLPLFYGPLSGITWVSQYQKKYSPTHTSYDHQSSPVHLLHPPQSTAPSLFSSCTRQSLCITSPNPPPCSSTIHSTLHTFLHLTIVPSHSTRPHQCNLYRCSTKTMSPNTSLSFNQLPITQSFTSMPHIQERLRLIRRYLSQSI